MAQKTSTATGDKKLSAKAAGGGAPPADAGAAFRQAMSRIAAPVYIVATDGPAGLAGLTATAVASVSDAPPILLVCVNRSLSSASRFIENGVFSVNALTGEDRLWPTISPGRRVCVWKGVSTMAAGKSA